MATKTMKATALVLDYSLYPRHELDAANLAHLARSLEAGESFPPVHIDKTSRRVIDGFHRVTAALRFGGEDATLPVDEISYTGEAAMFLAAIAANTRHGVKLTRYDQARCVELATAHGIRRDQLAGALCLTTDRLGELEDTKTAVSPSGEPIAIKHTAAHLAGRKLTKRQAEAIERSSGMKVRFYAEQVLNALDGDIVDWTDALTVNALGNLHERLTLALAERA